MPSDARTLERAVSEDWTLDRVADELDVDADNAAALMTAARNALSVVDAENPAEAFRNAVRQVIQRAAKDGLDNDDAIEQMVVQICYRVSDLAHLLKLDGNQLGRYSRHLRREPDHEYYDGYFDEEG